MRVTFVPPLFKRCYLRNPLALTRSHHPHRQFITTPHKMVVTASMAPESTNVPDVLPSKAAVPTEEPLRVKLLNESAKLPTRGSALSAGHDLYSCEDSVVPPRGKALVKTGLQMRIPAGCYGRVAPRSGLALKKFIDVGAGVIDADYNGEVGVVMFNFSDEQFIVKTGDRIAQLILERISMASILQVDKLDDTERGAGGFGSTGTN